MASFALIDCAGPDPNGMSSVIHRILEACDDQRHQVELLTEVSLYKKRAYPEDFRKMLQKNRNCEPIPDAVRIQSYDRYQTGYLKAGAKNLGQLARKSSGMSFMRNSGSEYVANLFD